MKVGLIGWPSVGKSALFRLLTGAAPPPADRRKAPVGAAKVPDRRVDELAAMYRPKKVTYASLTVTEAPGLVPSDLEASGVTGIDPKGFVDSLRDIDLLAHVVRAFDNPSVPHVRGDIAPADDAKALWSELLLTDWQLVQTRMERLQSSKKKPPHAEEELQALAKASSVLEAGIPMHAADLSDEERERLSPYSFFTQKPAVIAVNLDEGQLRSGTYPQQAELAAEANNVGAPLIEFASEVEADIAELDADDRDAFMADLGLQASGVERLARAAYDRLGLISYFTVGEGEVRAWTIRRGSTAKEAAGAIHSDIRRGFIRAEVADYDELVAAGGWNALREKGRVRLEGKDYIMQDGDIVSFRFNV